MPAPKNNDPFRVWNGFERDNSFAPHNGFDGDNPFKPWNSPFGSEEDLSNEERRQYNLPTKRNRYEDEEY